MRIKFPSFEDLIIFEDADYIVINKPPYLSSLDDRQESTNLLQMARSFLPSAQLCHRLDKETSGILVIARHPESYRRMSIQFEKRNIEKFYHAVVEGIHDLRGLRINAPISSINRSKAKIDYKNGKSSLTIFNSKKAYRKHTLVQCQPVTGRMHQIRIHLSSINAPIAGDLLYGGKPFFLSNIKRTYRLGKFQEEKPLINRLALHARMILLPLKNKREIQLEAPYPKDFQILLNQLDKNS
jgi:23S rRNA pseudouridine955/2504/2580 synthase